MPQGQSPTQSDANPTHRVQPHRTCLRTDLSEKLEKAVTVDFKKTPGTEERDKAQGSFHPKFSAGARNPEI